jgi:hypothetical protein
MIMQAKETVIKLADMLGVRVLAVEEAGGLIRAEVENESDGEVFACALALSGVKAFYSFGRYTRKHTVVIH